MKPLFFSEQKALRAWFEEHHLKEKELWVGFYKTGTGKNSITWPQSVEEALCFGWIDGIRKSYTTESYIIRFTPRKPKSIWSVINIEKVNELMKKGSMFPAGMAAYERREENKSGIYSFEQQDIAFTKSYLKQFRANKEAWDYFRMQPLYYQRTATWWVINAKQEKTRLRRLEQLIADSAEHKYLKQYRRTALVKMQLKENRIK